MTDTMQTHADKRELSIGDRQRQRIIQTAYDICIEQGFSKVTINGIAKRAGITRTLIYHYFEDKDAVADAMVTSIVQDLVTEPLREWNDQRVHGNLHEAIKNLVVLMRTVIDESSLFSSRMIGYANGQLYLQFIDRTSSQISDFILEYAFDDLHALHTLPIKNLRENLIILIIGMFGIIRQYPLVSDETIRDVAVQTLRLESFTQNSVAERQHAARTLTTGHQEYQPAS